MAKLAKRTGRAAAANVQHAVLRPGVASGIHVLQAWEVADQSARLALAVTAADEGKICRQLDNNTYWMLASASPATWRNTSGAVTKVFGRVGDVVAVDGDYTSDQISNTSALAGTNVSDVLEALNSAIDVVNDTVPVPPSSAPPPVAATSSMGTPGTYAAAGHTHAHGDQAGGTLHAAATTTTPGFLSAADKARLDGIPDGGGGPAAPAAAPPAIAAASAIGTPGAYATEGHTHAHGSQAGGALHALATTSVPGFFDGAEKQKLAALSISPPVIAWTSGDRTLQASDAGAVLRCTATGSPKLNVPANATVSLPVDFIVGLVFDVASGGPLQIVLEAGVVSVTLNVPLDVVAKGSATLQQIAPNRWWIVLGTAVGGGGAPTTPSYLLLAADATLPNERVLAQGAGMLFTDGGPGGALSLAQNGPTTVATTIAGDATLAAVHVGQFLRISNIADATITIPDGIPIGSSFWIFRSANAQVTVQGGGSQRFYHVALNAGSAATSFQIDRFTGLVLVTQFAANAWSVFGDVRGGDSSASYVTLAASATLANERVLTEGAGIRLTDSGAGGALTVAQNRPFAGSNATAYTLVLADAGKQIYFQQPNTVVTVPADASVNHPPGTEIWICQGSASQVSLVAEGGVTLFLPDGRLAKTNGPNTTVRAYKVNPNAWLLSEDLAASGGGGDATKADKLFPIRVSTATSETMQAADSAGIIRITTQASVAFTVPTDAVLNLPIGFTSTVVAEVGGEDTISIAWDAAISIITDVPNYGGTLRLYTGSVMTLVKLAANRWLITGNVVWSG